MLGKIQNLYLNPTGNTHFTTFKLGAILFVLPVFNCIFAHLFCKESREKGTHNNKR